MYNFVSLLHKICKLRKNIVFDIRLLSILITILNMLIEFKFNLKNENGQPQIHIHVKKYFDKNTRDW